MAFQDRWPGKVRDITPAEFGRFFGNGLATMGETIRENPELVEKFALDVPEDDARTVAELMTEADLLGYDTHGLFRLRQYVNRLRGGAAIRVRTSGC